jgi:glucose-6-phosphate dehydrogenase assembly protein OpcA
MHLNNLPAGATVWEGQSVGLDDIERELGRLWNETAGAAERRHDPVRARVLNLVVHTSSDADAKELSQTISRLSSRHPLRAIVLSSEPDRPHSSLDTAITTYCQADPATGAHSCCEVVLVGANGEPANHLAGIVAPLLAPDLPVCLWWLGAPQPDSPSFNALVRASHKLIIDSSTFEPTPELLRRTLETARRSSANRGINDLNWIRLWPWFDVVAQFFDDRRLHGHLDGISRLVVEYAVPAEGARASQAQPLLLSGWLYSRLGVSAPEPELVPVPVADVPPGDVVSFMLETSHDQDEARFHVAPCDDSPGCAQASAWVNGRLLVERGVVVTPQTLPEMLDTALARFDRDAPYEESVAIAADLLERGQAQ